MQHPDCRIEVIGNGQGCIRAAGGQHLGPVSPDIVHLPFRDLLRGLGVFNLEGTAFTTAAVVGARESSTYSTPGIALRTFRVGH